MRVLGYNSVKAVKTWMEAADWTAHGGPVSPQRKFFKADVSDEGFWGRGVRYREYPLPVGRYVSKQPQGDTVPVHYLCFDRDAYINAFHINDGSVHQHENLFLNWELEVWAWYHALVKSRNEDFQITFNTCKHCLCTGYIALKRGAILPYLHSTQRAFSYNWKMPD